MKNKVTTIKTLQKIIKDGEGPALEFKRSTGELKEALQTVYAFLNGSGGMVIFGVSPKGTIDGQQVSDKTLIPPDAMREILVNALIHRDYSIAGGSISLAIFDDRVEVWSIGGFPEGITPSMLSRNHPSVQRNPTIADVFHRTGLIEKWGRGTNRVIEMCVAAGVKPPKFEEIAHAALVTFYVNVLGPQARLESELGSELESQLESLNKRVLMSLKSGPLNKAEISVKLGQKQASGPLHVTIRNALQEGIIERTIPEKPNSRLQKYRLTEKGHTTLDK